VSTYLFATDESNAPRPDGFFYRCGLLAPEDDWGRYFIPAWREAVIESSPKIPHLHMREIYNAAWCAKYGLTRLQADAKVTAAVDVLSTLGSVQVLGSRISTGHTKQTMQEVQLVVAEGAVPVDREYPVFVLLNLGALVAASHEPECTRVDTLVEENGVVTSILEQLHASAAPALRKLGWSESIPQLMGEFKRGGKKDIPLQAADVVCWFAQRADTGNMNAAQRRHNDRIAKLRGFRLPFATENTEAMKARAAGLIDPLAWSPDERLIANSAQKV
jgi:hypothetical protein